MALVPDKRAGKKEIHGFTDTIVTLAKTMATEPTVNILWLMKTFVSGSRPE